jgi:hypothetical protein
VTKPIPIGDRLPLAGRLRERSDGGSGVSSALGLSAAGLATWNRVLAAAVAAVLLLACNNDTAGQDRVGRVATPTTAAATAATNDGTTTPVIDVNTTTPPHGEAGPGCVNGWTTPNPGTVLRTEPLDIIREQMDVSGEFHILDMRYFTGPEVPWILEPRWTLVQRWYVKAELVEDPTFRARWLVERRSPAIAGIAGVAAFATTGYQSPDWRGFLGDGEPRPIAGLPGTWVGFEFDFLTGEDGEKPGLPDEVIRCLDGT